MENINININPKDIIFALDIGTRSVIGTVGVVKDNIFYIVCESYIEHEERAMIDGQIHDISLVAKSVNYVKKDLESKLKFPLKDVAIAAAGRFLRTVMVKGEMELDENVEIDKEIIRSLEITSVKNAEEKVNKQTEGKLYCVGYSVKNYYLNDYVISNLLSHKGDRIAAEVIATFLPRAVVDSLYAVIDKVGLNVTSLTLEPIAAIEAAIPKKLRLLNLVLVDIGAGTSDIAISLKDSVSAFGMVPLAGDEVTEAIAQSCLVDFNTAEKIKKECFLNDKIKYIDVIGIENEISTEDVIKIIMPIVDKIALEISNKIVELNGGKAPNAVFLVGGGAHTPKLKEIIAEKLGLPENRIAVKGREAVSECKCENNDIGSTGVTVLGIALVSIKRMGNDFIDVVLNDSVVSLFNSHKHTVMDVMMQAGVSANVLIGKNGENIRFTLNGIKRIAFGSTAVNAEMKINGEKCNIDSEVNEGDNLEIEFAKNGKCASPKVLDYVKNICSVSFYLDNDIKNIDPVYYINGKVVSLNEKILEGDEVEIIYPTTFGEYRKYFLGEDVQDIFYCLNKVVEDDYAIKEGDIIYREEAAVSKTETKHNNGINVIVNDKKVELFGKDNYVFVDIFDNIQFDLTRSKGKLVLELNNNTAGYYDKLNDGDIIKVFWE